MTEFVLRSYELPQSTADCDKGPKIEFTPGKLNVHYDYYSDVDEGWVNVRFNKAISQKFIPDNAVTEFMINAYSKICIVSNSKWLMEIKSNAKHQVNDSINHFIIYFDHNGCLEVLAESFSIE